MNTINRPSNYFYEPSNFKELTKPETILETDSQDEKNRKTVKNSLKEYISQGSYIGADGKVRTASNFGEHLSGYATDGRITIWGKISGLDETMSASEIADLKDFVLEQTAFMGISGAVWEGGGIDSSLLDSADLSVEEFKKKWLQTVQTAENNFKNARNAFYNNVNEYNSAVEEQESEKKFKPIQVVSKSKTYVDKDVRREFFENFLKVEREKGTDIWDILQKLNKINKVNISA